MNDASVALRPAAEGSLGYVEELPSANGLPSRDVRAALEAEAAAAGVDALYLLTTTAADFSAVRGHAETPRDEAPAEIRATSQFETLCPSTAVCLRTEL